MLIGVTGGSGSGKSTAVKVLRELGAVTVDADEVYHELLCSDAALLNAIDAEFPGTVKNGKLDRKALGTAVFQSPERLERLSCITHPFIQRACSARLGTGCNVIDAFSLDFRGGGFDYDHTVAVVAPREDRIRRLTEREGISRAYAEKRIDAQKTDAQYMAECEYTLVNDGTREQFREKCLELFRPMLQE